jgi:hypothetical protein
VVEWRVTLCVTVTVIVGAYSHDNHYSLPWINTVLDRRGDEVAEQVHRRATVRFFTYHVCTSMAGVSTDWSPAGGLLLHPFWGGGGLTHTHCVFVFGFFNFMYWGVLPPP